MATAAPPPVVQRENRVHVLRLLALIEDEGTTIVRNIFDDRRPIGPLDVFLAKERDTIIQLRNGKTITQFQYDLLFPQTGSPKTADFDFTLTLHLLRNLKPLGLKPNLKWYALPQTGDLSMEADLRRLQNYRNELAALHTIIATSEQDFKDKWSDIENIICRLNASLQNPDINLFKRIHQCKDKHLDPEAEEKMETLLTALRKEANREKKERLHHLIENSKLQKYKTEFQKVVDEMMPTPSSIDLLQKALLKGTTIDRSIRVNVVGNYGQGKTSLVKRLMGLNLNDIETTNGIDLEHFKCERQKDGKLRCVSKQTLFSRNLLRKYDEGEENISYDIDIWDFGGQYIYYATHTLFHSKRAIYLLVVDLSQSLDTVLPDDDFPKKSRERNMKKIIKFWMHSIHSFVGSENGKMPKVILVGTHKDVIHGKAEDTSRQNENEYFNAIRALFDNTNVLYHIHSADFAVDNTTGEDESIDKLRDEIFRLGGQQASAIEIPKKWVYLEEWIQAAKFSKIVEMERLMTEASFGESMEQIKLFLSYCHAKGILIYFDEEPISEYIVVDPQYLINAFKSIITSKRFSEKDADLRPLWQSLMREAKLEKKMIDIIWRREGGHDFFSNKDILLAFLKKHNIISQATQFDDATQKAIDLDWYIVPSLLTDHKSHKKEMLEFLNGKSQTVVRCILKFDNFSVVPTLYHRLVAATLGKWFVFDYDGEYFIYEQLLVFKLDIAHIGLIEMNGDCIDLAMIYLCPKSAESAVIGDGFRRYIESVISFEFRKLRTSLDDKRKQYRLHYRCNHETHDFQGSKKLEDMKHLEELPVVPCPDSRSDHQINASEARNEWFQDSEISNDLPSYILTDKDLSKLTMAIGGNWELLGVQLGVSDTQIDHLKQDNSRTAMRIYKMLRLWQSQHFYDCTIDRLVITMKACRAVHVDWDEVRNIIEELKLRHSKPEGHVCTASSNKKPKITY